MSWGKDKPWPLGLVGISDTEYNVLYILYVAVVYDIYTQSKCYIDNKQGSLSKIEKKKDEYYKMILGVLIVAQW